MSIAFGGLFEFAQMDMPTTGIIDFSGVGLSGFTNISDARLDIATGCVDFYNADGELVTTEYIAHEVERPEELTKKQLQALPDDFLLLINEGIENYVYWEVAEEHQRNNGCTYIKEGDDNYDAWLKVKAQWSMVEDEITSRGIPAEQKSDDETV